MSECGRGINVNLTGVLQLASTLVLWFVGSQFIRQSTRLATIRRVHSGVQLHPSVRVYSLVRRTIVFKGAASHCNKYMPNHYFIPNMMTIKLVGSGLARAIAE